MGATKTRSPRKTTKKSQSPKLPSFSRSKLGLIVALVGTGLIGVYFTFFTSANTGFEKVADHPQAVQQPTALGKNLWTLKVWQGSIYGGFGDYGANTGPIALTPFDGTSFATTTEHLADTEAIYLFREINGKIYALSADPKSSADYAVGTFDGTKTTWANGRPIGAQHAFDMLTLNGTDLWIIGSLYPNAVAWRSTDGGATWANSLAVGPKSTTNDDFARFYGAIVHNGKLYVQAQDYYGGLHTASKVFDGTNWTDGPNIGSFNSGTTFAGKSIYHGSVHVGMRTASLMAFDGVRPSTVSPVSIRNYTIDGNYLYILGYDGSVRKTTDLSNWVTVGTGSTITRSIAVLNGQIFLGGSDGVIYRMTPSTSTPTPPPSGDTTAPTVTISSPINGSTIGNQVNVTGSSQDNAHIAKTEIYIDNKLVKTFGSGSAFNYRWGTRKVPAGQHIITVKAYDTSGNVGHASVTVSK